MRVMRTIAATACLLLAAVTVSGQGQPAGQPPAQAPAAGLPPEGPQRDQWLDAVLKNWETAMSRVQSLEADCERVTEDPNFKTKEIYRGTARFLKGDTPGMTSRASLYLVKTDNPKVSEHLILSGAYLYEVVAANKVIRVHTLPQPKAGENGDNNLVALLFGMKADQAKKRYKIELVHADANYFYLRIHSQANADKADFSKAQLALLRTTYLPRQLEFLQVNGHKVTWDLPRIQSPANNLRPADFQPPDVKAGWKMDRIPTGGEGPNKIRSSGN